MTRDGYLLLAAETELGAKVSLEDVGLKVVKLAAIYAEAPNLLEALEQASTAFESACAYVENTETRKFLLANAEIARTAIAKATSLDP